MLERLIDKCKKFKLMSWKFVGFVFLVYILAYQIGKFYAHISG